MTQIFVCRRQYDRPSCHVCHTSTDVTCRFALKGKKAGQHCGRPICGRHVVMAEGEPMCFDHAKLMGAVQR